MKIVFCGYRNWSINLFNKLKAKYNKVNFNLIINNKEFKLIDFSGTNFIICAGWSWIIPNNIVDNYLVIGTHPSDLPAYAGGSPIQNQIINGIVKTKNTLFRLSSVLDGGEIIYKNNLLLEGNIENIFKNFEDSSYKLIVKFINNYPNNPKIKQNIQNIHHVKRLKPKDSELTSDKISKMTCKELYNFIRCRTNPYPNVFIKDKLGILKFNDIDFEPNE